MKQLYTVLAESLEKMTSPQRSKFFERRPKHASCEVLINLAESILGGKVTESEPIKKNNGRADNGHTVFTESDEQPDVLAKAHNLCNKYMTLHKLSEADARRVVGLPLATREQTKLTEQQYRYFELGVLAGRSERDALASARQR